MLIGAFGRFWERDLVDFESRGWRLLGRQGLNTGALKVADFRRARGVYILYNEIGVYYVGLAAGKQGLGGRLKDHTVDEHGSGWSRFSWFSLDDPSGEFDGTGVTTVLPTDHIGADTPVLIRDIEALLQVAMQPFANRSETRFQAGSEWIQVATQQPLVWQFDDLAPRLSQ